MGDITLSKAVRSNLLNLQSTATQLGKTQEKLATGLKVNSALDNPTNFFTASSLNSRAGDLGSLLDSVSNAVQTIAAADKGISAITKLVESAQATARQALQTAATVDTTTAAVAATTSTSDLTGVTISAGSAEVLATEDSADTSAVTITAGAAATAATVSGGSNFTSVDVTGGDKSFTIDLGAGAQTINLTQAASGGDNTYDETEIQAQVDAALGAGVVTVGGGGGAAPLSFTTVATGASAEITLAGTDVTDLGVTSGATDTGSALVAATAGDVTINGQTITLADGDDTTAISNAFIAAAAASSGANAFTVSNTGGVLSITGASGNDLTIGGDAATLAAVGLTAATTSNTAAVADTTGDLTINGQTVSLVDGDDTAAIVAKLEAAATASTGTDAFTVSNSSGTVSITGTDSNSVVVGGAAVGSLGLTAATTAETAASTTSSANPQRDVLRAQYNDLLTQIDQLAADTSFNGVNLLDGDSLSVLFNEDGTSSLDVTGVTFDAAGLGLTAVSAGGFDTNADINSTLDLTTAGIDSLRSQSSTFGSNLSVVETRQDFTKNIINVLETGAANLTLADSNEEAANLLALQTRQQLSSTALSLASQADQNVLRLF